MKKLIALLTIAGFMTFGISNSVLAQQEENVPQTEQVAEATEQVAPSSMLNKDPGSNARSCDISQ